MARIESADFDCVILSPPCGSWSRANYSDKPGPKPVRSRKYPWGIPHLLAHDQRRAANGNEFVHFSIRAIVAAQNCKRRGRRVTTLWEHPEDLGATKNGCPASVWQLPQVRNAYAEFGFITAAGYQCQFPDVDYPKPTRVLTDITSLKCFGYTGWPQFTAEQKYLGPLPRQCGHRHYEQMIGRLPTGGFATSPKAAYPPGMCELFARHIFDDFMSQGSGKTRAPCGREGASKDAHARQHSGPSSPATQPRLAFRRAPGRPPMPPPTTR